MITIVFDNKLTTLNDYISAERTNKFMAAKIKREETEYIRLSAMSSPKVTRYPVKVIIHWHCKSQRTDPDNIAFAVKFILDGLVKAGVLGGDTWRHVSGGIDHRFYESAFDFVRVELVEKP